MAAARSSIPNLPDLSHLTPDFPCVTILCGKTGSGKSNLAMDYIARGLLRPAGPAWVKVIVMSPTAGFQTGWKGWPACDVYEEPNEFAGVVMDVIARQKAEQVAMPVLLVFDDVVGCGVGDKAFRAAFSRLITAGRPAKISTLIITQTLTDPVFSNPLVRTQGSYLICGNISGADKVRFGSWVNDDKDTANEILTRCWSEPYRFCVINEHPERKVDQPRLSFVKIDPRKVPRVTIKYRK